MPKAIALERISKRFGTVQALDDVSLTLMPGERLGLIGENGAGKSSLMNVLYGLYQPDAGRLLFDGTPVVLGSPRQAIARGIGMVHQHFTLVPTLTVAENVVLGHEPVRGLALDLSKAEAQVSETAKRLGFVLDPHARVDRLSVGSQQKVEIVKALHRGATTLILDEPTAVLTPQEADELFAITRALSAQGTTVVLISHKLHDVLAFASRIAVMRAGRCVADALVPGETSPEALAELMVGQRLAPLSRPVNHPGEVRLAAVGLEAPGVRGVNFTLRAGEVLGIAGVDGNGQRELAEVITGLRRWTKGTLTLDGRALGPRRFSPHLARALGIAHVPEDRLHRAILSAASVEENASLGRQDRPPFARGPLIDFAGRRARTVELLERHDVRPRDPTRRMGDLSGGNQQKLVVGRELDAAPTLLVVVQPTRGLDIAAVQAVRGHLLAAAAHGAAVLLISLDLDEVLELADRVLVMFEGRFNGEQVRPPQGNWDARALGQRMLGTGAVA